MYFIHLSLHRLFLYFTLPYIYTVCLLSPCLYPLSIWMISPLSSSPSTQMIPILDIREVSPEFQKLNKTENCILVQMKNDSYKVAITSPVSIDQSELASDNYVLSITVLISTCFNVCYFKTLLNVYIDYPLTNFPLCCCHTKLNIIYYYNDSL